MEDFKRDGGIASGGTLAPASGTSLANRVIGVLAAIGNSLANRVIGVLAAIGNSLSIGLSIIIFAVGLIDVTTGALSLLLEAMPKALYTQILVMLSVCGIGVPVSGLGVILRGLELLFLAPIVALTFLSSIVFLRFKIVRLGGIIDSPGQDVGVAREAAIASVMHQVKLSVTGLMISVLLIDLIARVISGAQHDVWSLAASGLGTLLSLTYYLLLTRTQDLPEEDGAEREAPLKAMAARTS